LYALQAPVGGTMKKLSWLAAVSALLIGSSVFVSCGGSDSDGGSDPVLDKITVDVSDAKTFFAVGDDFSYDGLVVKAVMSDKTKKTLSADEYTVALAAANLDADEKIIRAPESGTENGHSEEAVVTVTYEEKTATYNVTVSDVVTKLELTIGPDAKAEYDVGEEFDPTDITVTAFYGEDDTEGEDVTESATFTVTVKDDEGNDVEFTTDEPGTFEVTLTAEYAGVKDSVVATVTVIYDANLIKTVTFKSAYLAPGWSAILDNVTDIDDTDGKVVVNGKNVSYELPAGLAERWQAQLLLGTDADVAENDYWFFSCKLTGVTGGYTIKLNNDESLISQQTGTIASAEDGVEVLFGGKASAAHTDMPVMFDFGTCSDGTVVISDLHFEVVNIDEVEAESLVLTPATSEIYEGKFVTYSAALNGLYPVDVTLTTTEEGVEESTVDGNTVTVGSVTGDTNGTVTVTAAYNGVNGTATITVKKVEAVTDKDIFPLITNINPGWGQTGSCSKTEVTDVDGYTGEVASFVNCNYQGWELTATDASLYKGIAVEYYTDDENLSSMEVFPINAGGAGEYKIQNTSITKGAWTTAKFAFADDKDAVHANINQLKFTANDNAGEKGNFYIKAIYFYAE